MANAKSKEESPEVKAPYGHMTQEQRDAHFFEKGVDEYGKTPEGVRYDAQGNAVKVEE